MYKKFSFHQKKDKLLMTLNCYEHKMYCHCIKMESQKIVNFLVRTSDDKDLRGFCSKKWIEVYHQSGKNYNANKEIKKPMLRSDLHDFSDAYIFVKGNIATVKKNIFCQ